MKLHRYVDHQRLHIVTKDVISLSISVLLLFRHYISHKITFGAPSSGGVLRSACGAFIQHLIRVCTVCLCPTKRTPGLYGLRCVAAQKKVFLAFKIHSREMIHTESKGEQPFLHKTIYISSTEIYSNQILLKYLHLYK